jgi:maltose-binding protein MalE
VAPEERRDALRNLLADAAHVAGVEVAISVKSADGLAADVRAASLAGLPLPDLVWGSQDDLGILQRAGAIQPADDGLEPGDFLPATVEGATLGGERWGTPLGAHGFMLLLYNRARIESAPRTTDELILGARRLNGGGSYGLVAGWAEARWFAAWLHGVGGAALGPDGTPTLDTPQTVAAINLLRELRRAGPPPPSSYAQGARLFREGRAALAVDGDWSLEMYRAYSETLDLGVAPMPRVDATGRRAAGPLGGLYLMYGAGLEGERLEHATDLGRLLARPELQVRVAQDLGALPALRGALGAPEVAGDPALAAAAISAEGAPGIPPLDELRCAWDAIESALPSAILGDLTPEEAAARMQELALACVRA